MRLEFLLSCALCFSACASAPSPIPAVSAWPTGVNLPDVQLSLAPFDVVHVNWKQRLAEPYIYLENLGDYREVGRRFGELLGLAEAQNAPIHGAPFILFYDDPGQTPQAQLRARLCIALDDDFSSMAPLALDQLSAANVVYAAIAGPYDLVPQSYPKLFEYMRGRGWTPGIPIRESYLVSPVGNAPEDLVSEVQIPWGIGG